jgi:hypothetical protein
MRKFKHIKSYKPYKTHEALSNTVKNRKSLVELLFYRTCTCDMTGHRGQGVATWLFDLGSIGDSSGLVLLEVQK